MDRRTLLTAGVSVIGSSVTGCLENRGSPGGSDDSDDSDDPTGNSMTDSTEDGDSETSDAPDDGTDDSDGGDDREPDTDGDGSHETRFEVLGSDFDFEVSASVAFDDHTVTVTGTIQGNNTCHTARLDEATIENRGLLVNVESYDDADEDEGCMEAVIGIEYEAVVVFDGDPPTEVTVEHNGVHMTTENYQ